MKAAIGLGNYFRNDEVLFIIVIDGRIVGA
jgi:hypothetical protein